MLRPLASTLLLFALIVRGEASAEAGDIPIVTLGDAGPDQEVPTDRAFYIRGDVSADTLHAQAIVIRRGSPSMFGGDGPSCHDLIADLELERTLAGGGDPEEGEDDDDGTIPVPRLDVGVHRGFELFPTATGVARRADILVTAPWERTTPEERSYRVLVPHDRSFFSAGYGYCLTVVTTEHGQVLPDSTLAAQITSLATRFVACGDKASCDEDALADYETATARSLTAAGTMKRAGKVAELAALLTDAARSELTSATGIVEATGHMSDRFFAKTSAMPPVPTGTWGDIDKDPFAHAVAGLLAGTGALLPQVRPGGVALYTPDGKIQVRALQLLEDGRSIRVASSMAPRGNQATVLATTTESLAIADDLTLYDLIELGAKRVRVDQDWISLRELGDGLVQIGQEAWTSQDSAFLVAAHAQLKRLADYVDLATSGVTCDKPSGVEDWLACHKADAAAIESMREQLASLVSADQEWAATKARAVARARRVVTLTTTVPAAQRISFSSRTWLFSYVTPIVGYAGLLQPDETFGLFYLGAQVHLDPNPVDDVQWREGVTTKDLRRAIALELGVAPRGGSFGPDMRYDGPGSLPPLFIGAAVHVLPYTSVTLGASILERRNSTLREEEPHVIVSPYLGFTLQLNLPDLLRTATGPTTDTAVSR